MTVDAIVNRRGGLNSSLYQSCLALRKRLAEVPGFEPYLTEMDLEEQESDDETDPVTSMWNMLRRGFPLMTIYNALQPRVPLEVNSSRVTESKLGKAATFKFLQACLEELKFPANECFLITDLYGQDTTGFVKVLKVVKRVLDTLEQRGLLLDTQDQGGNGDAGEPQIRNHQQNIIEELVSTERDYVQHLETLQQFKNQLEQSGAIPGDVVHEIFLNLNALLDFQRRFLIRIEQQNSLDPAIQNWGHLFAQYQDSFRVYEPFIANQIQCNNAVMREWDKIKSAPLSPALSGMVSSHTVLTGFLLKPFQRLAKYPLLLDVIRSPTGIEMSLTKLQELHKKGDFGTEKRIDLEKGAEATKSILDGANAAIDKVKRLQDVNELVNTVDDWKGHRLEHFGELVLSGGHTVLKGEGTKEVEREVRNRFISSRFIRSWDVSARHSSVFDLTVTGSHIPTRVLLRCMGGNGAPIYVFDLLVPVIGSCVTRIVDSQLSCYCH